MKIQDNIHILEKSGEFLDGIFKNLIGSKHNLSAKFGKESQLISATNDGLSITGTKFLTAKKSKEHLLVFRTKWCREVNGFFMIPSALQYC